MIRNIISGDRAASIAASIEEALHSGRLQDRLPPIRGLAATLRVSPVTVAAAYRLLRQRGLTVGGGRRGTRIRVAGSPPPADVAADVVPGLVDLASGNPDPALLPALEGALADIGGAPHLYGGALEWPPLVSFAASEFLSDGIPAGPVVVTSGGLDGIERVLHAYLRAGDRVGVEDPTFPALVDLLSSMGVSPEPIALDEEGPRPDSLERALTSGVAAVVLSSRAQNPTGAAPGAGRASELSRLLRGRRVLLVELDDVAAVSGVRPMTLAEGRDRWAVVKSTSKFLGPDLRVAVVTGDETTVARVRHRQAVSVRWVSHILQKLALSLWSDPSSGRRLARAAAVYAERRAALVGELAALGMPAWGRSGLNVWIPVREEAATVRGLAERGWAVSAGERFRLRSPPAIRVTTSALAPPEAKRFAADLAAVAGPRRAAPVRGARAGFG